MKGPSLASLRRGGAALVLAAALAGPALTVTTPAFALSVDANTLVTYTGTGWSLSVPPGWGPVPSSSASAGSTLIGGPLPGTTDGSKAALVVANGDPQGQGLDVIAPAFISGVATGATIGKQANIQVDGQTAVQADFSASGIVGRANVWIENSKWWAVLYFAPGTDPIAGGVDMFTNQLMPTWSLTS